MPASKIKRVIQEKASALKNRKRREDQLSDHERLLVSRLVRLTRHKSYWLGAYIETLIALDAARATEEGISPKHASEILETIKGLSIWREALDKTMHAPILSYFGHRFFPDRMDRGDRDALTCVRYDQGEQFRELVRMWRLDHPEPPKNALHPSGHLDRKDVDR